MDKPSLLSPPRNDAPWWVLPLLAFFAGLAIPLAVLMTVNATPEFQRGRMAGFQEGITDPKFQRDWYETGWTDHETGSPKRKF